tara:strand:- start:6278 stop:7618 length:1341 start_codon:yes stop_codon:yes gene_type:complete
MQHKPQILGACLAGLVAITASAGENIFGLYDEVFDSGFLQLDGCLRYVQVSPSFDTDLTSHYEDVGYDDQYEEGQVFPPPHVQPWPESPVIENSRLHPRVKIRLVNDTPCLEDHKSGAIHGRDVVDANLTYTKRESNGLPWPFNCTVSPNQNYTEFDIGNFTDRLLGGTGLGLDLEIENERDIFAYVMVDEGGGHDLEMLDYENFDYTLDKCESRSVYLRVTEVTSSQGEDSLRTLFFARGPMLNEVTGQDVDYPDWQIIGKDFKRIYGTATWSVGWEIEAGPVWVNSQCILNCDGNGGGGDDGDMDEDGIPDSEDPDIDGDGIDNQYDSDIDNDGIPNSIDNDDDNDGIPDAQDSNPSGSDGSDDYDGDGKPNEEDEDIDGDGIPNVFETGDEDDLDGDGVINSEDGDMDGDGVPNSEDDTPYGSGVPTLLIWIDGRVYLTPLFG